VNDFHDVKVFATSIDMRPSRPFSDQEMREFITVMNKDILERCLNDGMTFLGHLKGVVRSQNGELLRFNLTRTSGPSDMEGTWSMDNDRGVMDLNVLAFGLSEHDLTESCLRSIDSIFTRYGFAITLDLHEAEHEHCHFVHLDG
jgi:hypothetical protein